MAEILSPSNLTAVSIGETGWHTHMNNNVKRLNDVLLKLGGLPDVNTAGAKTGDVMSWDQVSGKWSAWTPPV